MYSRIDNIDSVHITDAEDRNPPYRPIKSKVHILNTIGLSHDYSRSLLFYSDIQKSSINSVYFNGSDHRVLADRKCSENIIETSYSGDEKNGAKLLRYF